MDHDDYAKAAAQSLVAMGLAGKWQLSGACKVAIQNSGSPGAAVCIRVQLPQGLAGIGMVLGV